MFQRGTIRRSSLDNGLHSSERFGISAAGISTAARMEPDRSASDYRVEVSGWDIADSFFVEKVVLRFTQDGERVVHLKHPVRAGLVVFLRLIRSGIHFPALPVAYLVTEVISPEEDGIHRVALHKLRHRRSTGSETAESGALELP
jgi:hypothetical protein